MGTNKTFQTLFLGFRWSTVCTPSSCKAMSNVRLSIWRESVWPSASCEAKATKESIKTKTEKGNCFCIRVFYSIKLTFIAMPTNLEYRERERQRKRESRATGQRSSTRKRPRAREKKQRRGSFLLEEQLEILYRRWENEKCLLPPGWKWATRKKKWTRTRTKFPP